MRKFFKKFMALSQLVLILLSITGLQISEPEFIAIDSSEIGHFSGHDPFHNHSEPCQNGDHPQHVCHVGHCAFVLTLNDELRSKDDGLPAKVQGFFSEEMRSLNFGQSLFRPPISLS